MARVLILVASPERTWPVTLQRGLPQTLGRGAAADVRIDDAALLEKHLGLEVDEEGVTTVTAFGPALLNGVQVSVRAAVRPGDELSLGGCVLVFQRASNPREPLAPVFPWEAFQLLVAEEIARSPDDGALLLSREPIPHAGGRRGAKGEKLFGMFGSVVPPGRGRATVEEAGERVFELALSRLLGLPLDLVEDEQLAQDPVMLRLLNVAERLASERASVLITGEEGTGKWAYAQRIAPTGKAWRGESLAPPGPLQIRRAEQLDAAALERLAAARRAGRQLVATARVATEALMALFPHVVPLPALRLRASDIEPLAEVFLTRARRALGLRRLSLSPAVRAALQRAPYPRNVAELKWAMEIAALVSGSEEVGLDSLPKAFLQGAEASENLRTSMKNAEKEALLHALGRTRWNVSAAARLLGLPRRTVVYRMSRLGMRRPARG